VSSVSVGATMDADLQIGAVVEFEVSIQSLMGGIVSADVVPQASAWQVVVEPITAAASIQVPLDALQGHAFLHRADETVESHSYAQHAARRISPTSSAADIHGALADMPWDENDVDCAMYVSAHQGAAAIEVDEVVRSRASVCWTAKFSVCYGNVTDLKLTLDAAPFDMRGYVRTLQEGREAPSVIVEATSTSELTGGTFRLKSSLGGVGVTSAPISAAASSSDIQVALNAWQ